MMWYCTVTFRCYWPCCIDNYVVWRCIDMFCSDLFAIAIIINAFTGMFPVGDTSSGTLIAVCVRACVRADISLYCAKNDYNNCGLS